MITEHDKKLAQAALADQLEQLAARVRATPPLRFTTSDARGVTDDSSGPEYTRTFDGSAVAKIEIEWAPGSLAAGT